MLLTLFIISTTYGDQQTIHSIACAPDKGPLRRGRGYRELPRPRRSTPTHNSLLYNATFELNAFRYNGTVWQAGVDRAGPSRGPAPALHSIEDSRAVLPVTLSADQFAIS